MIVLISFRDDDGVPMLLNVARIDSVREERNMLQFRVGDDMIQTPGSLRSYMDLILRASASRAPICIVEIN